MMKRFLFILFMIFAAQLQAKEVLKIGVICPLTGPVASVGEEIKNGMLVAVEDLKNKSPFDIQLIFEDDMMQSARSATAAQKLIIIDKVDALVTATSSTGNVVNPLAARAGIIHIGIASDADVAKGKFNFTNWTPPQVEAELFIQELIKRGFKKISSIELKHQKALAVMNAVQKQSIKNSITLKRKSFNSGERDFRVLLAQIKKQQPDLLMIMAFPPELELIAKQARDIGLTVPISTIETFEMSEQKEIFNGCWFVSGAVGKSEAAGRVRERLVHRFGQERFYCSGFAYDSIRLLNDAFNVKGQKGEVKDVLLFLQTLTNYPGICGALTVDSDGVILSPASLKEIRNGKVEIIE